MYCAPLTINSLHTFILFRTKYKLFVRIVLVKLQFKIIKNVKGKYMVIEKKNYFYNGETFCIIFYNFNHEII
ncbi:hypothetical protein PFBG_02734 [Plasmodium falciparum 7G8]|uniref:Uncharacterized protein n=2 Tax=Plasmodium falciparum TaxID=5833 RepID=W7F1D7_PLAF8|nr:hypothetical protein PFNF135_02819 [Plasmodium falciparum NF135/5.C10]EUR72232.1 hypothetical protein PFBG_02734 [Plasmodium falciparum 7G8]